MNREKKAITVALYGLLIALAMVLSFVETMIPIPISVPGIKLGLSNLVTVVGLYLIGIPGTIAVTLIRIVLVILAVVDAKLAVAARHRSVILPEQKAQPLVHRRSWRYCP